MVENDHIKAQILTKNHNFQGHITIFRAEFILKYGPFKSKNNAQIPPKLLKKNFEKVRKTTFSTSKYVKTLMSILAKRSIFGSIFEIRALIMNSSGQKKIKSIAPAGKRYLKKKKRQK